VVSPITQTNAFVDKIIERKYSAGIAMLGYGKSTPLWSIMPKSADFLENTLDLRNQFGLNPSGGATVTAARLRQGASAYGNFRLTQSEAFGSVAFRGRAIKALTSNAKRGIGLVSIEVEAQARAFGQRMNRMLYQNYGGALGIRITSGGNTQTITVYAAHRPLLKNIWPGQYLVTSNTDGTSGSVDNNPTVVTQVNPEAGTITTSAASWDASGGFSNDDYLFLQSDFGLGFYGLADWIPAAAPSGTFLDQNRGLNPVYLGGVRYTASAGDPDGTIWRSLNNASVEGAAWGAQPDVTMMNTLDYGKFINEIEGRIEYTAVLARRGDYADTDGEVKVGISGVRCSVMGNAEMVVIPDNDCPRNTAYMLDLRTFKFHGVGMTEPEWLDHTGKGKWHDMKTDNEDGMEALMGIYGNLGCDSPGCNIRVDLTNVL
jgi:hypothetical protein